MQTKVSQTYKPTVRLTGKRGWYKVQSGTNPSVFYETSANTCSCPARKPCKHMKFVRALNVTFFVKKEADAPAPASLPPSAFTSGWDDGASAEAGDTGPVWRAAPAASPQPATTSRRCVVCGDEDHYLRAGLCVLCEMDVSEAPVDAPVVVPMTTGAPSGIMRPIRSTPPAVASLDAQVEEVEARLAQARRALHDADQRDDSYAVLWRQVDTLEREVAALHYSAIRAA